MVSDFQIDSSENLESDEELVSLEEEILDGHRLDKV
jgi:hypothetical protein